MSVKNVKILKLMVKTNVDKTPYELTISKLHYQTDMPISWTKKSEYPFFTQDIEYPDDILSKKTYSQLLHIFFDKREFIRVIINREYPATKSGGAPERIADKNIMTMLQYLFPTSYPYRNNINTSFNKYLKKKEPGIKFSLAEMKSVLTGGKFSYINTSKGICTVTEVIWLNDVLNNAIYRELVNKLIQYEDWKITINEKIAQDMANDTKLLTEGLKPSSTVASKDNLHISKEEIEQLNSQKRIYNPDDIKKDMIDTIKSYFTIEPGKESVFDTEVDKMAEYFINIYIKNKTPLTQFVRFKEVFNFKYNKSNMDKKVDDKYLNDLFELYALYDGADKATNKAAKEKLLNDKQKELGKLENGYIDRSTYIFGKNQINAYIEALKELIEIAENGAVLPILDQKEEKLMPILNTIGISPPIPPPVHPVPLNPAPTKIIVMPGMDFKNPQEFLKISTGGTTKGFTTAANNLISKISADKIKELDTNIANLQSEIAKLRGEIAELSEPNKDAFQFKNNAGRITGKQPISAIKTAFKDEIIAMQQQLFKNVITRYNRFQEINKTEILRGEYAELDGYIDNMTSEIEKLNGLTNPTPNNILNITEIINSLFDKLVKSNKITIPRTIGEKIAKIIKLSNHIKLLNQIQTDFFPENPTGIFVNYEKDLDKTNSFNALILDELKQTKYATFVNMVSFIQDKFIKNVPIKSLNKEFSTMLENYFANKSNEFNEHIVKPASKLINEGIYPRVIDDLWNVSVSLHKKSDQEEEYEISLYINLIEGEINSKNKSEINCQFLDDELTKRFKELVDQGNVTFEPPENPEVFSIKEAKNKQIQHEQKRQQKIEAKGKSRDQSQKPPATTPVQPPIKTGGKTRKTIAKSSAKHTYKKYGRKQ